MFDSQKYDVNREVSSIVEYKEAVEAAETLGLELQKVSAYGYGWESPDGPVHPDAGGGGVDVVKVGRKYLHMKLDGKVCRVAFGRAPDSLDDAKLVLRFS